jgi:hypothetical protein
MAAHGERGAAEDAEHEMQDRRSPDSFSEGAGLLPAAWRFERAQALGVSANLVM